MIGTSPESVVRPARRLIAGIRGAASAAVLLDELHHNLASISLARTGGAHIRVVRQRHVDDAALAGRHGLEGDGATAGRDAPGDALGQNGERLVASLLVASNVHEEVHPVSELPSGHVADQELESAKRLPAAADEEPRVIAVDIECGSSHVLALDLPEGHGRGHTHERYQILQDFRGCGHNVRRLVQDGHAHPGGLATDPENTGLARANDVYFDVLALDVELL